MNDKFTKFSIRKTIKNGFTLIELLIVIAILGVMAAFLLTNMSGARARARDAKAKSELRNVATAIGLYQSMYGQYPPSGGGINFNACGPNGTSQCPYAGCSADFAAGGGGCANVFMDKMSKNGNYFFFKYYPCSTQTDYRLKVTLENASDPEIATSKTKCPASTCGGQSLSYSANDYILCP